MMPGRRKPRVYSSRQLRRGMGQRYRKGRRGGTLSVHSGYKVSPNFGWYKR